MEVEYNITEKDSVKSAKLHAAATRKQFVWLGLTGLGLLLFAVFGPDRIKNIGYFGLIGGILGYFITIHVICPWQAKRNYRGYKTIQQPMKLEFTDDGFIIMTQNGIVNVKWDHLIKWRENDEMILVFFAPKMYYLVPKRISDRGFDIESFRQLLQEKLGSPI